MATIMGVTIVSVKAQTAGDARTDHVADHAACKEARRSGNERASCCAECTIEQPLSRGRSCRCQYSRNHERDRNHVSHDSVPQCGRCADALRRNPASSSHRLPT